MDTGTRWVALAATLGLGIAFFIWGRPQASSPPPAQPVQAPAMTGTASASASAIPAATEKTKPGTSPAPAHGATRLKLSPDILEFGTVPLHESRSADLKVENPTDKTIQIRNLDVSCGCIQATTDATEVAPGKSATIRVNFVAASGRKPETTVRVTFKTDESGEPRVVEDVHAKVRLEFEVNPDTLIFKLVDKNTPKSLDAVVSSEDKKPFVIKSILCEKPEFTFKWEKPPNGDGSSYIIHATMLGHIGGMITDAVAILTDRSVTGQLNLSGTIKSDLEATPSSVNINKDEAARGRAPFTTVIKRTTPGRLEILDVAEGTPAPRNLPIEYEVERLSEDSCRLTVRFKQPYPGRAPYGHFKIKTNVEEHDFYLPFTIKGKAVPSGPVKSK